jgi:hypothetical protein
MKNRIFKSLAMATVLCAAVCLFFTGCTMTKKSGGGSGAASQSSGNNEGKEAAPKDDEIEEIDEEEIDLEGVEAAPEEDEFVDQGREGRPTDSWNADVSDDVIPIKDESDLEEDEEGSDEYVPIDEDEENDEDAAEFAEVETGADSPKRAE